jgi:hypothetical protein
MVRGADLLLVLIEHGPERAHAPSTQCDDMSRGNISRVFFELIWIEQLSAKWNQWCISVNLAVMVAVRSSGELEATRQRMLSSSQHVWHLVGAASLKNIAPIAHWPLKNVALLGAKINQLHTEMATSLGHLGGKLKLIAQNLNNDSCVQTARARAGDQRAELVRQIVD